MAMILPAFLSLHAGCGDRTADPGPVPEVIQVEETAVTIAWQTPVPSAGQVAYRPAGSIDGFFKRGGTGALNNHEVRITGLAPGKRYAYMLGEDGPLYQFQTRAGPGDPFSFLIAWGETAGVIGSHVRRDLPDFILYLGDGDISGLDGVRPLVPVYSIEGPDSPYLRSASSPAGSAFTQPLWTLDWGALRLVFARGAIAAECLDSVIPRSVGIVLAPQAAAGIDDIGGAPIHALLIAHNQKHPDCPVVFVILDQEGEACTAVDGITYIRLVPPEQGILRLDVAGERVRAVEAGGRELLLREPPLAVRRTCEECRLLADRGAYEESVEAYRAFIAANHGHYQVDDACLAIAEILDGRLFRFDEAVHWYTRLVTEYPDSTLVPPARQRIAFLGTHADNGYEPLRRFERLRKYDAAAAVMPEDRHNVMTAALGITEEFPASAIAPDILYWIANQYRTADADRAVTAYRLLIDRYPDAPRSADARIEIGETLYDAGQYRESRDAFKQAREALPELGDAIAAQLFRAERNLRRRYLAWAAWGLIAAVAAAGTVIGPRRLIRQEVLYALIGFAAVAALLAMLGWMIVEQFRSPGEMLLLACAASVSASAGFPLAAALGRCLSRRPAAAVFLGIALNLAVMCAGLYAALFHINEHYLVVIGL